MSGAPSNRELLSAVRAWAAANYPGCPLEFISIHCRYLARPVRLVDGPAPADAQPKPDADERGDGLSPCVLDILKVLRELKRPLSRTRLQEEMAKRGMYWSDRTVARYLAHLMEDGTVENPEDARPRGYRLPPDDQ